MTVENMKGRRKPTTWAECRPRDKAATYQAIVAVEKRARDNARYWRDLASKGHPTGEREALRWDGDATAARLARKHLSATRLERAARKGKGR